MIATNVTTLRVVTSENSTDATWTGSRLPIMLAESFIDGIRGTWEPSGGFISCGPKGLLNDHSREVHPSRRPSVGGTGNAHSSEMSAGWYDVNVPSCRNLSRRPPVVDHL